MAFVEAFAAAVRAIERQKAATTATDSEMYIPRFTRTQNAVAAGAPSAFPSTPMPMCCRDVCGGRGGGGAG